MFYQVMLKYRMAYLYSGPVFLRHRPSTSSAMETASAADSMPS